MTARSKAWIFGISIGGIAGSNPTRMHGYLSWVLCVVSGLCDGPITGPEESYRVCGVFQLDGKASIMRPWLLGAVAPLKKNNYPYLVTYYISSVQ